MELVKLNGKGFDYNNVKISRHLILPYPEELEPGEELYEGMLRYNPVTKKLEKYDGEEWVPESEGGGGSGGEGTELEFASNFFDA